MIYNNPNTVQQIVNRINSHKDFTYNLDDNNPISNYNYIVSVKNIFTNKCINDVKNLRDLIKDALNDVYKFESLGLWYDKEANVYCFDGNLHFHNLDNALNVAKLCEQKAIFDIQNNTVITL